MDIRIIWPREKGSYGKKTFEIESVASLRKKHPLALALMASLNGKTPLAFAYHVEAWKTTEAIYGFVPQNHPLKTYPL